MGSKGMKAEVTDKELKAEMVDKELKATLDRATIAMAKAKALIDEGETIKKDVKEQVLPLMASFGVKSNPVEGVGVISLRKGSGSAINPQLLTVALLEKGIPAEEIQPLIEGATKKWSYDFVEFRAPKKG